MEGDIVKAIFENNEDFLRRHMVLSTSVIETLREHDVIGEVGAIQMENNQSDPTRQMTVLLICLKSRGLAVLQRFLNVLRLTFHGWIADEILESRVELPAKQRDFNNARVRDIVNIFNQRNTLDEIKLNACEKIHTKRSINDMKYKISEFIPERDHQKAYQGQQMAYYPIHFHTRTTSNGNNSRKDEKRLPSMEKVPHSLKNLQRIFEVEANSARNSLDILKQEELTIKVLLQQNLREQQVLLAKQETLAKIKEHMQKVSQSATLLYKPEQESRNSLKRLRHLQRTYWASNSR